jgi:hypothetical protein
MNEEKQTDDPVIHIVEFRVCDPCVQLKGEECHTPECVFCFRSVSDAARVLDDTLICPIIDGERHILIERAPIDMLLFCPRCNEQHIDDPQSEESYQNLLQAWSLNAEPQDSLPKRWLNPPHRSHECQFCFHVWRPADVATNGVAQIATEGKRDGSAKLANRTASLSR